MILRMRAGMHSERISYARANGHSQKLFLGNYEIWTKPLQLPSHVRVAFYLPLSPRSPGISKVFHGGAVCYHNDAKVQMLDVPESMIEQHGAVSEEVAIAMATGACEKYGADYGLSVTGFAGPTGGTQVLPVGSIFLGYSSPVGVWAKKIQLRGDRASNRRRAATAALDWMRRKLRKYKLEEVFAAAEMENFDL